MHNSQSQTRTHSHAHASTPIALHKSVNWTNATRGSYPLNVSAGSDSLGPTLLSDLSTLLNQSPSSVSTRATHMVCFPFSSHRRHIQGVCFLNINIHHFTQRVSCAGMSSTLWVVTQRLCILQVEHEPLTAKRCGNVCVNVESSNVRCILFD